MKKLFYIGVIGLGLFEILNVYFIMPMPGSQRMNSIDLAYFLYSYRWFFRIAFALLVVAGSISAFRTKSPGIPAVSLIPVVAIIYYFNFEMTADHMFLQPEKAVFQPKNKNVLNDSSIVVAVTSEGEAKAYPIRFIQYHHQVRDTIAGKPIMVTYCNVCRTGRVFEPVVNGKVENFRLVGMDHFNAMFEDQTTKSWWRQATGEAITGKLKGNTLPEVESNQFTLNKFFSLYPFGQVMQGEQMSRESYDTLGRFEKGKSKGKLTRTDSLSWNDKSWVIGIQIGNQSKAYDWNELKKSRIIHDQVGKTPIMIAIGTDEQSFTAFKRNSMDDKFLVRNDSLINNTHQYDFAGHASDGNNLTRIKAYQEFWHSWKSFHPETQKYSVD
jgi:hypothetical protein